MEISLARRFGYALLRVLGGTQTGQLGAVHGNSGRTSTLLLRLAGVKNQKKGTY